MSGPDRNSPEDLTASQQHLGSGGREWITKEYITRIVRTQSPGAYSNQLHDLRVLQQQADILIAVQDQANIKLLADHAINSIPETAIPILDLEKYFPKSKDTVSPIKLAVIEIPGNFPVEEGRSDLLSIMRTIDKVMQTAGVRRRVFETFGDHECYKLDSDDINCERAHK